MIPTEKQIRISRGSALLMAQPKRLIEYPEAAAIDLANRAMTAPPKSTPRIAPRPPRRQSLSHFFNLCGIRSGLSTNLYGQARAFR